jgi:hypothetical protein
MNERCGGLEMHSLTKTDDETARPPVAGLSRLGSDTSGTSNVGCLFRGSSPAAGPPGSVPRRLGRRGPGPLAAGVSCPMSGKHLHSDLRAADLTVAERSQPDSESESIMISLNTRAVTAAVKAAVVQWAHRRWRPAGGIKFGTRARAHVA